MNVNASNPMPVKRVTYAMSIALSFMIWTSTIQEQLITYNIKSSAALNHITFNYLNFTINDKLKPANTRHLLDNNHFFTSIQRFVSLMHECSLMLLGQFLREPLSLLYPSLTALHSMGSV